MSKQFVRVVLPGFLVLLLAFGGINLVSAAKPTPTPPPGPATPMQIYGAWQCGNHYCDWSLVRNMTEFDQANHWLIDRGNGQPSVNLVVLSFVNPLKMLNQTDTGLTYEPRRDESGVVDYFRAMDRVMLSIGGITYTDDWDAALAGCPHLGRIRRDRPGDGRWY